MSCQSINPNRISAVFLLTAILLLTPVILVAQEKIAFQSQRDGDPEVYLMNPDGTNPVRLTTSQYYDGEAAISPDGTKIAFSSYRDGNAEIYIMSTNGSSQTNLTNDPSFDGHPTFSPDGSRIAFASGRGGHLGIWVMNVDGSNLVELQEGIGGTEPAFSPDGTKIVFCGTGLSGADSEIWVMSSNGLNRDNLSKDFDTEDTNPSFSPDGTKIVFTKDAHGAASEIIVMNANGTNPINLTNNAASDYYPSYSPNGSFITFTSLRDGNAEIYVMNADGSNPINMTRRSGLDQMPVWGFVANSAPVLDNFQVTSIIDEGGTATLSGEIIDADANDNFRLDIIWGDGQQQIIEYPIGTNLLIVTHTYADDPSGSPNDEYTVSFTLDDHHGGFDSGSKSVTVNNVSPIVSGVTATPGSITPGGTVSLSANYTDPGFHGSAQDEDLQVLVSWGDGQSTSVTTNGVPGAILETHQYDTAGNYTISIQATDNDGGATVVTTSVVVSAPALPATPTNFRVQSVGVNQIQLAWTDASNNENGFSIERCTKRGCTNFAEVGRVGANVSVYSNGGLSNNTQYFYRMRAFNAGGFSSYTNVLPAKTLNK
jgi:TolB protein